ncbi:MAG: signal peptide peptidase SppA, partial [Alloprevotella sp.]
MKDFIKYTLASMVGVMLVGVFAFVMSMVMITAVGLLSDDPGSIKSHSVLHLHLSGTLQDRADAENPFAELMGNSALASQGLDDYLTAIREAATNDDVDGIYIESGVLDSDYATLQALRKALVEFKKSKKFIVAYADSYTQAGYYVASVADKVYLNPAGMLDWHGIASQPIFYTGLLEKLGVKMQVFKVGTYKSAVEPFILKGMSEANRAQVSSFISDIWQGVVAAVAQSRRLPVDTLNAYADRYVTFSDAADYKRLRLVDELAYVDQVRDVLRKRVGGVAPQLVTPTQLALTAKSKSADDKVAVYYAEGAIVDVSGTGAMMGSSQEIVGSKVVSDLDALANDKDVKAVVLRINSGGGSAYASEQMWRAIQLLKKKKPVVVSMGGMAASGGYYMACGANYIFAEPATLTGSIGIFGMIPDASE